jgi:L-malate glycosyltransferase
MKVFACHLLNDYSGSPKVLMQLVKGWRKNNLDVTILTCSGRTGFLSDLPAGYIYYWYKWSANPFVRLIHFAFSQILLFIKVMGAARKSDIVYVNTVLPFGAALAGKLKGCKVIYHLHETSVNPKILKLFLFKIVELCANEVIYVSEFLSETEKLKGISSHVLYNAIEDSFFTLAKAIPLIDRKRENVLMVASLKIYKGVFEFVSLAQINPQFNFRLVVNASQEEIDAFFCHQKLPENLMIYSTQTSIHRFYRWADVVLNLSRPDAWVETFGLTVLEGMAYSLPAIVPPTGGITELVEDDVNGFLADCRDLPALSQKLNLILNDQACYHKMQQNAFRKLSRFRENVFIEKNIVILHAGIPVIA